MCRIPHITNTLLDIIHVLITPKSPFWPCRLCVPVLCLSSAHLPYLVVYTTHRAVVFEKGGGK